LGNARYFHSATLLPNGKVLAAGGSVVGGNTLISSELYDHGTGTWSTTDSLVISRYAHTATLLYNNKVLAVGGYDSLSGTYPLSTELYTP
jgi:hypothetical protein